MRRVRHRARCATLTLGHAISYVTFGPRALHDNQGSPQSAVLCDSSAWADRSESTSEKTLRRKTVCKLHLLFRGMSRSTAWALT